MKIIEDLYYGQISPYKNGISATPEYQKLKAPATQNENLLRATLSDEQKERLFVFHHIHHQLHSKSESGDEHIPF